MKMAGQKHELSFSWQKPLWGYKWEDAVPCSPWGEPLDAMGGDEREKYGDEFFSVPKGPFLMEKHPSFMCVPFAPLENPLLFAQFSDIAATEDSFLAWANEHGRLIEVERNEGYEFNFLLSPLSPKDGDTLEAIRSCGRYRAIEKDGRHYVIEKPDPLSFWIQEHRDLSFAVMLWEFASNHDPRLKGILEWCEDTRRAYAYPFDREKLGEVDFEKLGKDKGYSPKFIFPPRRIENYHPQKYDAQIAASRFIQQEINRKLAIYPLETRIEIDERGQHHYVHEPSSLLSAMWFQFSLALAGEIKLKRCSICGRWENMEGHRESWSKHANCANYDRVKRARNKKKGMISTNVGA